MFPVLMKSNRSDGRNRVILDFEGISYNGIKDLENEDNPGAGRDHPLSV